MNFHLNLRFFALVIECLFFKKVAMLHSLFRFRMPSVISNFLSDLKEKMSVFGLMTKIPTANFTMLVTTSLRPTAAAISFANAQKKGQLFAPCPCVTHYHFLQDPTNARTSIRISTLVALDSSAMMSWMICLNAKSKAKLS